MDPLGQPLQVVRQLFAAAGGQARSNADTFSVEQHFAALLRDPITRSQIPLLTASTIDLIPNNGLCRYKGMVQDMADPEFYVGAYKRPDGTWQTTKYADHAEDDIEQDAETVIWERRSAYCVRIPGESSWIAPPIVPRPPTPSQAPAVSSKRPREDTEDEDMDTEDAAPGQASADVPLQAACKLARTTAGDRDATPADGSSGNSPPAGVPAGPQDGDCLVYVYDKSDSIKLNDVVEVLGVLSRAPELAVAHMGPCGGAATEEELMMTTFHEQELAAHLPTSLVPRLHGIIVEKQTGPELGSDAALFVKPGFAPPPPAAARAAALTVLQSALGGDALAAEYLLLQLISRVYARQEGGALGALSLNLTGFPPVDPAPAGAPGQGITGFAEAVKEAVSALVPRCLALPLTTAKLNQATLRPRRDYTTNRLVTAELQAAPGTILLLDEIPLQSGTLSALGLDNLKALKNIIESNAVDYNFEYYQLSMPTDMPVTILSTGPSLLKASVDVVLPLLPVAPFASTASIRSAVEAADLGPARAYIANARVAEFTIDGSANAWVEQRLVEARQADRDVGAKDFHTWLTVARLLALSHGESGLTEGRWAEMRALEQRRAERQRLASSATANAA